MTTTNKFRSEVEVTLADQTFTARLSLDGIVRVETALQRSIIQVAQRLSATEMTVGELIVILYQGIKGGGNDVDEKKIKDLISEAGLITAMAVAGEIVVAAIGVGDDEGKGLGTESE